MKEFDDSIGKDVVYGPTMGYAIDYATKLKDKGVNVKVINISQGTELDSKVAEAVKKSGLSIKACTHDAQIYNGLVADANDLGISVVVSAGNSGIDASYNCLVNADKTISVSAIRSDMEKASFSDYGNLIDLTAPGVDISSSVPGNLTKSMDGTSMAAPHVSAQIALLYSACPTCSLETIEEIVQEEKEEPKKKDQISLEEIDDRLMTIDDFLK